MKISKVINGKRVIVKKPELLAPAGSMEKLKTAIIYGADAVFIGGKEFSLRASASNFSLDDIKEAVIFAKRYGAHIHVTCNMILHQENLQGIREYLLKLDELGVSAIIVADMYIMALAKSLNLSLEVHVSTQMSVLNSKAIDFFQSIGMDRVVLGRETCYSDLKKIRQKCDIDLEYFIHGAMCINYSGRCTLSNYFSKRDANRGGCSQSCRWNYDIYQGERQINTDGIIPFSMSSKDMSLVDNIPELIELGIDSFKIEGRMKSIHYIATVVSTYRKLIDDYCADPDNFVPEFNYRQEITKAANRALCDGFYYDHPDNIYQLFNQRDEHPTQDFCLRIINYNLENQLALIEQRNYFKVGEEVEIFSPKHKNIRIKVIELYNKDMEKILVANHPMEELYLKIPYPVLKNDLGRRIK